MLKATQSACMQKTPVQIVSPLYIPPSTTGSEFSGGKLSVKEQELYFCREITERLIKPYFLF